ncbi:hypothetical protein, partial [Desulfovibrio sp. DV]|uniref:hypothetical protein n=1 Tax=Desulfovibrio sp. DV TaxID=1844708 RepID=UPI001C376C31
PRTPDGRAQARRGDWENGGCGRLSKMGAEFVPMMPPLSRLAHQDKFRPQPALGPEDGADRFEKERPDRVACGLKKRLILYC